MGKGNQHTQRISYKGLKQRVDSRVESAGPTRNVLSELLDTEIQTLRDTLRVKLGLMAEERPLFRKITEPALTEFDARIAHAKQTLDRDTLRFIDLRAAFTDTNIATMCGRAERALGEMFTDCGFGQALSKVVKAAVDDFIKQRVRDEKIPPRH